MIKLIYLDILQNIPYMIVVILAEKSFNNYNHIFPDNRKNKCYFNIIYVNNQQFLTFPKYKIVQLSQICFEF